ncbi:MAG: flagellar hook protein FlgE [Acetobacteraceae bacterium]|nr:flagellar hook protein FlgE [Acetobacteraceae bacterium]
MSLFGAMSTAISGLNAQSSAFSNISDNVANSQTDGYKEVDTSFVDYLTTSTSSINEPGAVTTLPDYTNNVQGTISQSSNPLALAITGQGFFAVSEAAGASTANNAPTFSTQTYYTRDGNFQMDQNGFLVNDAGEYLQGWAVDPTTGMANQSKLAPIQITQTQFNPIQTTNIDLSANLPAGSSTSGTNPSSQVDVYDSQGVSHSFTLTWTPTAGTSNSWNLSVTDETGATIGSGTVSFAGNGPNAGTINAINGTAGTAGTAATISLSPSWATSPITLNLGNYDQSNGVTQFAASSYSLRNVNQNGVPPGSFTGITINNTGEVQANYNNGQSLSIAQVPVITFGASDDLQRQNGQAFTPTTASGNPIAQASNTNGAGSLVTGAVESSNVDIATEFSKLIVAQQAYSANAKMITTADAMMQTTINMKT